MAVTKITYTGNGSQTQFTIPFEYIAEADVDVYIDTVLQLQQNTTSTAAANHPQVVSGEITQGTALINYTFANATTIQFNSAPANGAFIFIERTTDDTSIVTFTPGSTIRAQELNSALEQVRFIAQEGTNTAQDGVVASKDNSASIDGQGKRLENLADANSDDDAVTRAQLGKVITDDLLEGEAIDLTDATGGSNSNKQVTISVEDSSKTNKGAVSINEGHAIGVTYTSGDAVIAADKSTASQQGVVKITAPSVANGNPITLTRPGDGEVELTIADGSIDVQKIKGLDKADTSEYASTWDNDDDQVATVGAIAKRLDAIVSTSQPTTAQVGKFWYNPTEGINALYMWNGTSWKVLTSGTPYIPAGTTIVRYVDAVNGSDDVNNSGFLPQSPLRTIKRAITLINASASGDGTLVVVEPGVYQEALPLRIEKNNVSVVGKALRSCFIHPTVATENNNMWEVDSGSYIANFTMLGLKVPTANQGSRNNAIDNDSTYGLPSNQPFAVSFRSGNPVILKSPYIQNCTHFSDAHFDNANFDPNTFPSTDAQTYSAVAGDQTSAPCGGGLLVDGSVPASTSPIRSMVVDAFTQITLDGPGILVTNNGYAQLVSFFGTFCHYHAKAKNGGQINLSNCVTDFGRYGLIAEGKSPTAIATATASAANAGATTVTIGSITSAGSFHGTVSRPLDHMMITIDGTDYGVVSSTANGSGWDVTITPALASNISNNSVSFALRSYISTGGHTFEYVGVGTDYSDHPDNGGVAIEANQVKQLSGGKVWQSSTDHIGKFKAGNVLTVDQIAETLSVNGNITVTGTNAINGNITVTGTVDGRDVATDGTKLDGIEAGATADQTAAEIRTLVESATDSNVFTDADHTKLNGIETGATADQTATEIKTAYESNSNTNAFTDAEKTKLSGIATGATAYANSDVDAHLNQSTASSGEVLSWNGSDYDWIAAAAGYSDSSVDAHLNRSTAATNEVLSWNGSDYDWVAQASGGLSDNSTASTSLGVGTNALDSETSSGEDNTAFGYDAGTAITSGQDNTAIGKNALKAISTNGGNTAVGSSALQSQTSGTVTGVGFNAGVFQTTGTHNVYLGWYAGFGSYGSSTASFNTFLGSMAGFSATSGGYNIGIGYQALYNNSTGSPNVAVGFEALRSSTASTENTGIGYQALHSATTGSYNTAIGQRALQNSVTDNGNTAVGREALMTCNGGGGNTAVGNIALKGITTGDYNAAVGSASSPNITSGSNNVSVGYTALYSTTMGTDNVAVGSGGLYSNTTGTKNIGIGTNALYTCNGNHNIAIGYNAGDAITTADRNIFIGTDAGTGTTTAFSNIAIGYEALQLNVSGASNVAIGWASLKNNTGGYNSALGNRSLQANTSGMNNVAVGYDALLSNTIGTRNTAVGFKTGDAITEGNNNTLLGAIAGGALTTGDSNVAVGHEALRYATASSNNIAIGKEALAAVTTGAQNVVIGTNAGDAIETGQYNASLGNYSLGAATGSQNTALGYNSGSSITSGANNIVIGYDAQASAATVSNEITLGNSSINSLRIPGLQTGAANGSVLTYNSSNGNITLAAAAGLSNNSSQTGSLGVGSGALSNDSGTHNTAFGVAALDASVSDVQSTAVGASALTNLTTGGYNTAVGFQSNQNLTAGSTNTSLGAYAGYSYTTASSTTSVGYAAAYNNTGANNTAIGAFTLFGNAGSSTGGSNVSVGYYSLYSNTAGSQNVAVGESALRSNTTGPQNHAFGRDALRSNTTGRDNIAIGKSALYSSNGDYNIAIGSLAGDAITSGNENVFIGQSAGTSQTTATGNTFLGYEAGKTNVTGSSNTYVGRYAGKDCTGSENTLIGNYAGYSLTSGQGAVVVGRNALLYATTGGNNVAVGVDAMEQNTAGAGNTTVGNYALQDNTVGGSNTAIGYGAGHSNTTSDASTYVGQYSGYYVNGAQNVAVGYNALKGAGSGTPTPTRNVALGVDTAENITSGYDNVFIGWRAGLDVTTGNNLIVIGKSATPSSNTGSDEVTLGNSSISTLRCNTQTISSVSDGRDKTEVEDLPLGLDFIDTLRPVKFKWDTRDGNGKDGTYDAGFIAQDLQSAQAASNAEYLKMVMDSNPDRLEAAYGQLIPVLVQAIKDLKSEIETLKSNV